MYFKLCYNHAVIKLISTFIIYMYMYTEFEQLLYRIAETLEGENLRALVEREHFAEKTFAECQTIRIDGYMYGMPKISQVALKLRNS